MTTPSLGRFTEPLPPEQSITPTRIALIGVAALMTLVLGGAVTFFLLYYTPYLDSIKPSILAPANTDSHTSSDTLTSPPPPRLHTPPPPRLQQHLKPRENEVSEMIDLLRTGYIEPSTILVEKLDQDSLQQIVSAPDHFARLSAEALLTPFRHSHNLLDTLSHDIAYWRPVRLEAGAIDHFVQQWTLWKSAPAPGLIIDLRYFRDGNNLEGAAMTLGLFTNPGVPLFSVQALSQPQKIFKTQRQPLAISRQFPVIVLVNSLTRGAGEILALLLRQKCNAILVGQTTAGEGGLYTENRLSSGRFLRMASQRVTLMDGTDMIARPLHPDVRILVDPQQEAEAFKAGFRKSPNTLIREPRIIKPRRDTSDLIATPTRDITDTLTHTDVTLQSAVDMIQAIHHQRPGVPTLIEFEVNRNKTDSKPDSTPEPPSQED